MGNKIACRICGGRIVIDPSGENGSCENCGLVYEGETLRSMIGAQNGAVGEPPQVRVDGPIPKADEPAPTPSV